SDALMRFDKARNRVLFAAAGLILALITLTAQSGAEFSNHIEQSIAQTASGYGDITLGQSTESYAQVKGQSSSVSQDNTQEAVNLLADANVQQSIINWAVSDNGDMDLGNEIAVKSVQSASEISTQSSDTVSQKILSYGDVQGDANKVHLDGYQDVCNVLGFSMGVYGENFVKVDGNSNVVDEANTFQAKAEAGYDLPVYFTQKNGAEIRGDSNEIEFANSIQNPVIDSIQQNMALVGSVGEDDEESTQKNMALIEAIGKENEQ
ncbi:MAG TPA: hypothetical protein VN455_11850, partial [Methanotrichaceae archaeon]|nr:hypothetical protein [Methanotrichaceae archaeon]